MVIDTGWDTLSFSYASPALGGLLHRGHSTPVDRPLHTSTCFPRRPTGWMWSNPYPHRKTIYPSPIPRDIRWRPWRVDVDKESNPSEVDQPVSKISLHTLLPSTRGDEDQIQWTNHPIGLRSRTLEIRNQWHRNSPNSGTWTSIRQFRPSSSWFVQGLLVNSRFI